MSTPLPLCNFGDMITLTHDEQQNNQNRRAIAEMLVVLLSEIETSVFVSAAKLSIDEFYLPQSPTVKQPHDSIGSVSVNL